MVKKHRFYGRDWHLWKELAFIEEKRRLMEEIGTFGRKAYFLWK
jgi:hypothetical protein